MLDKSTERLLRRMDRMGFAAAGEALREIDLLGSQLAMAHAETLEWIEKYNKCEKPDERDAEIERLREELVVAERVGGKLMEEREQLGHENERLRELLREAIDADRDHYATAMAVLMAGCWHKRVREALGE